MSRKPPNIFKRKRFEILNKFIVWINFASIISGPELSYLYGSYHDAEKAWKGYEFKIVPTYDAYMLFRNTRNT